MFNYLVRLFKNYGKGVFLSCLLISCSNNSEELPVFELSIENHRFTPEEVLIPANTKVNLIIYNKDHEAEEFDCPSIRREKIIPGNSKSNVIIAPLQTGVYEFFGEFHPHEAKGRIKVN
jgi:hypothetical protein